MGVNINNSQWVVYDVIVLGGYLASPRGSLSLNGRIYEPCVLSAFVVSASGEISTRLSDILRLTLSSVYRSCGCVIGEVAHTDIVCVRVCVRLRARERERLTDILLDAQAELCCRSTCPRPGRRLVGGRGRRSLGNMGDKQVHATAGNACMMEHLAPSAFITESIEALNACIHVRREQRLCRAPLNDVLVHDSFKTRKSDLQPRVVLDRCRRRASFRIALTDVRIYL
jgi:hypothetical protein